MWSYLPVWLKGYEHLLVANIHTFCVLRELLKVHFSVRHWTLLFNSIWLFWLGPLKCLSSDLNGAVLANMSTASVDKLSAGFRINGVSPPMVCRIVETYLWNTLAYNWIPSDSLIALVIASQPHKSPGFMNWSICSKTTISALLRCLNSSWFGRDFIYEGESTHPVPKPGCRANLRRNLQCTRSLLLLPFTLLRNGKFLFAKITVFWCTLFSCFWITCFLMLFYIHSLHVFSKGYSCDWCAVISWGRLNYWKIWCTWLFWRCRLPDVKFNISFWLSMRR